MTNRKLIFVSNRLHGGGAERVLCTLANEFVATGVDVTMMSFRTDQHYPLHPAVKIKQLSNSRRLLMRVWDLRKKIKQYRADVLISFESYPNVITILACMGLHKRVIISERNNPAIVGAGLLKTPLRNFLYRFCDVLVCQTPDAKQFFPKAIQNKTVIISNPLMEGLPAPYTGPRSPIIVNFCRLQKQKNLPLLIEAFEIFYKEFPQYTLEIYGNGPEKTYLETLIQASPAKSAIHLYPARPDIHSHILKSAMFVSSSDFEGLSNSMLEAMAIGLPVICTDCEGGGARMIIKNEGNGLLVPCKNAPLLANAMARVAKDKAFSMHLGQQAAKLREELDPIKIYQQWQKIAFPEENL